jgi:hypothetical protein
MPIRDRQGNRLWCSDGRVFCTDRYLMLNPTLFDVTSYLQFYDLDSLTLVRETRTRLYSGWTIHPDAKRLFLGYVTYFPGLWPKSGGMDVYNIGRTLCALITAREVNLGVVSHYQVASVYSGWRNHVRSRAAGVAVGRSSIRTIAKKSCGTLNTTMAVRLVLNPKIGGIFKMCKT